MAMARPAVAGGLVERTGAGRKRDPFKYWLCAQTDEPWANPHGLEDLPPLDLPPLDPVEQLRGAAEDLQSYYAGGNGRRGRARPFGNSRSADDRQA
jgi:hypothetical protein